MTLSGGHEILIFGGEAYDGRELTFYSAPWWCKFDHADPCGIFKKGGDDPATEAEANREQHEETVKGGEPVPHAKKCKPTRVSRDSGHEGAVAELLRVLF